MFNITNDKRRATVDIDIDLIRYSLEDKSILLLFEKLNQIETKIDIGVHKNLDIKQEEYMFNFEVFNNSMTLLINTKEQIFVEKL